ncbi:3-oxo-tetronate kinase [Methylobacterium gnaphalii]|uniref:3-oxo-tetronate kinase n=1 Tax=Methylobacterium gnaphalii TaxID=1010610 RepID=A0A512JJS4_9HYPH|nr:3-oxo-tetronate kinase [Methylobacterium gnaphalii]GEP10215.1 HPr kinase [Methylobacterium gnaphalii]GJD68571.1 3-oxo-tetronate kinase [Methylobacterium gnaphalii]GLS48732.1 HPr kinase [Methylobacterium gnaphalii]
MLLGVIADDFTGASDIAATIAKGVAGEGGLRTAQFLGVPAAPAAPEVEAGIVSLKSRSIPAAEAVAQSLAALDWLKAQGARQIVFKYCSTFDSTPAGNIGPVAEALAERLVTSGVVVCPAFPGAGRTIYQGHLFVNDRLLSESGMENHPLTPMTDPDIRRVLSAQARRPVGHVAQPTVATGSDAIAKALAAAGERGETLVVVDAIGNDDLMTIGAALADAPLVTGGSGIARGLPHNFIARGQASGSGAEAPAVDGPEAILAGSCSGATRSQIAHHRKHHPVETIAVDAVMEGCFEHEAVLRFVFDNAGRAPLVYSSAEPADIAAAQAKYGRERLAAALDAVFGELACGLVERGLRRLVVAGGETSGAVVGALGLTALMVGREIDPGVPVLVSQSAPRLGLALKSGNFGAVDFFDKALAQIAGRV